MNYTRKALQRKAARERKLAALRAKDMGPNYYWDEKIKDWVYIPF